ncbi:unnamed protein product [Scytosiphon promiscuus]
MAMVVHRRRPGRTSLEARQSAVVRHASAALLVLFLVFSSVSTTVFSTYSCDYVEDLGVSLLRADYSISCDHPNHVFYEWYAALMIFMYPIGIPALFAVLLLKRRDKINPPVLRLAKGGGGNRRLLSSGAGGGSGASNCFVTDLGGGVAAVDRDEARLDCRQKKIMKLCHCSFLVLLLAVSPERDGLSLRTVSREKTHPTKSYVPGICLLPSTAPNFNFLCVLESRAHNPDLQSTRFLWEPYEPDDYYYETVECGRRCLLTGALVFVLPNTAGQAAGACVFAFLSLLSFELLRPHLSPTDGWMYRIGCIVVFFSNFLALMAKADVSDEEAQSQEMFGLLLIAVHAAMVIAIISQAYLSMQATAESRDDILESFLKKSSGEARSGDGNDPEVPPDTVERGCSGGDSGSPGRSSSSAGAEVKVEVGTGLGDGRVVMWKHDGGGREDGADGRGDGHGGEDVGPLGPPKAWEDVEWPRWGRGGHARVNPSAFSDDRDDHIEDSVELESVYSQRTKKTSLVAGALGLGMPHRRTRERHSRAPGDGSDLAPSSLCRSSATAGSAFGAVHNRRSQPADRSNSSNGGGNGKRERQVAKGHVVRRSTGTWEIGGGGGGGRDHRHEPVGSTLSSSLSPVRHIRRSSAGGGGGVGGGRVTEARRAVGQRTISARQLGSDRHDGGATRARRSSTGAEMFDDGGDTTASKLERLHSLSRQREGRRGVAAGGGGGTLDDFPAPPKLVVSVSEGVARAAKKRPLKKGGRSPVKIPAPASGDALPGARAGRGVERSTSGFVVSKGTFV